MAAQDGLYLSPPVVNLNMNGAGELVVHGVPGKDYRIESVDDLGGGIVNWSSQHTFVMPLSEHPYLWSDSRAHGWKRYYRVVQFEGP